MSIVENDINKRSFIFNHCFTLPLQEKEKIKIERSNRNKILLWSDRFFQNKSSMFRVKPLRISSKTQVYKIVSNKRRFIFKCFKDKQNFLNEYLAISLFAGERSIPQLIYSCDESGFLVMEYIPQSFSVQHIPYLDQIAYNLGTLHAYGSSCFKLLNKLFPSKTEKQLLENIDKLSWVNRKNIFKEALQLSIDYYGQERIPLMIGDLKPEHIRLRRTYESVFIDMETFSVGFPDYLDVLSLTNFNPNCAVFNKDQWLHLLRRYLEGKYRRHTPKEEVLLNYKIISSIAKSLGYDDFFKE